MNNVFLGKTLDKCKISLGSKKPQKEKKREKEISPNSVILIMQS